MKVEDFVNVCPVVYHMAEEGSWPTIREHGLLSTTELLNLFEVEGEKRRNLEQRRRAESVLLSHPGHGEVVVRDQKPLRESVLKDCLTDGWEPEDWYRELNSKVFFWAMEHRVQSLLGARAYRNEWHTVLVVDSSSLLQEYEDSTWVTTINTGATLFDAPERGPDTFVPLADFSYEESRRKRGRKGAIAEVAIEGSVPNIEEHTVRVEERRYGEEARIVY